MEKYALNEEKLRDLFLRKLALGEIQGPPVGKASIDKPWLKYYTEEAIRTTINDITLLNYIRNRNSDRLSSIALDYFGVKISYQKLFGNIERAIEAFIKLDIIENDHATICLPNIPEFIYVFYALNQIGVNIQIIDPRTKGINI